MSTHAQSKPRPVREAQKGGEKVARSRGFEWLSRAGFVARGAVYVTIGVLALGVALGIGGKTTNQQGALQTIAQQPFGKVVLILLAAGFDGYALWRFVHVLIGHGPERSDDSFERIAAFGSGVVYVGLCVIAVKVLVGSGGNSSESEHHATAGVFGWPAGTWLVAIVGAALIGVALFQGYRVVTRKYLEEEKTGEMSPEVRHAVEAIATVGHLARMVVFGLVGVLLIEAAVEYDPGKPVGLDGALAKLAHSPYGPYLLGIVAAGLIAFGLYSFIDARYRRI